jgi:hypothetical protein
MHSWSGGDPCDRGDGADRLRHCRDPHIPAGERAGDILDTVADTGDQPRITLFREDRHTPIPTIHAELVKGVETGLG